ncbi:MAG: hypothetical protein IME99_10170, partial [Proteobacteria bacterium]|nr:hypothetical protein [Pseudomonadota bacterium]
FNPLTKPEVKDLAGRYLEKIKKHIEGYGKKMEISPEAIDLLVDAGYNEKYGARFLKRYVDEQVKVPITLQWKDGDFFKIDVSDDTVTIEALPSAVPEPA